jgi:hypothetical protein
MIFHDIVVIQNARLVKDFGAAAVVARGGNHNRQADGDGRGRTDNNKGEGVRKRQRRDVEINEQG